MKWYEICVEIIGQQNMCKTLLDKYLFKVSFFVYPGFCLGIAHE